MLVIENCLPVVIVTVVVDGVTTEVVSVVLSVDTESYCQKLPCSYRHKNGEYTHIFLEKSLRIDTSNIIKDKSNK